MKYKVHTERDNRTGSGEDNEPNNVNCLGYFRYSVNIKADREASRLMTQRICEEFSDVFMGIGCFEVAFKLGVREEEQPIILTSTQKSSIHATATTQRGPR